MLRGFYTAASGMQAQQRRQEALSNNMTNANTPGYKADDAVLRSFPEMLTYHSGGKELPVSRDFNLPLQQPIGSFNTGVYAQETIPDFDQGDIRQTNTSTDLALVNGSMPDEAGSVMFEVQNDDGEVRLTRNGHFTVDQQGFLTTGSGHYILDDAGDPIEIDHTDFDVSESGMLTREDGTQTQIGIAYTEDVNGLVKEGNGLYNGEAGAIGDNTNFTVKQGMLERSNVDPMETMTEMMNAYRSFEINQRLLRAYDENMGKTVSQIGRIG